MNTKAHPTITLGKKTYRTVPEGEHFVVQEQLPDGTWAVCEKFATMKAVGSFYRMLAMMP